MDKDYRDSLQELFQELYDREGMTRFRLSRKAGVSEQTISNVLNKRRNLSVETLEKVLDRLGYRMEFLPDSTGSDSSADSKLLR